jgi:hypothetical protein
MDQHRSTTASMIELNEAFSLLRQYTALADVTAKTKARYFDWLERCKAWYFRDEPYGLRIFPKFPALSSPTSRFANPAIESWYWCLGPLGLLYELPHASFSAVVSSRQSHRSEDRRRWFRKFLHAAQCIDRMNDWWLIFPNTATGSLSKHVANRCQMKSISVETTTFPALLELLCSAAAENSCAHADVRQLNCWVTPAVLCETDSNETKSSTALNDHAFPPNFCDALSVHLPHRVHVIDIREGGNIDRLVKERLGQDSINPTAVRIYRTLDEPTVSRHGYSELGAIEWLVVDSTERREAPNAELNDSISEIYNPIFTIPWLESSSTIRDWPYLTHCTRARLYEWSDQSLSAEWDRWLFHGWPDETSPWDTLVQIAKSQRLMASPDMTRNQVPTVSFSAVPLPELLSRRTYRNHLRRWDWEPYGVCITQAALSSWNAREVIYGDENTWEQLAPEARPWFQPRSSKNGKHDWQQEKEWRVVGDVRLRKLPWESVFFFVPTRKEAQRLSRISSWPIAVVKN